MSSPKGRVLTRRLPQVIRTGTCAWCGADCVDYLGLTASCPVCKSDEIDWVEPPAQPLVDPTPHTHTVSTHTPGSIAYTLLGGVVRGSFK